MFDMNKYVGLLTETVPQVIDSETEFERVLEIIDRLMSKPEGALSPEESKLLKLLATLAEDYEKRVLPPLEKSAPAEILQFLMKENGLKQKDIVSVFGSQGIASEVLSGKRSISKTQAKKLAERFSVSAELFI
jgi:HTH-type transcriptional regulator/antitoxin HigA